MEHNKDPRSTCIQSLNLFYRNAENWMTFQKYKRLKCKLNNEQTIYKNRTLTHNLKRNQPGNQTTLCSKMSRKSNHNPVIMGPEWLEFDSFPKLAPASNLGTSRKSRICSSNQSPFLVFLPPASLY